MRERNKEIRRLLWKWGSALKYCENRQAELKAMRALIAEAHELGSGPRLDGMPRGTGKRDPTSKAAVRAERLIEEYEETYQAVADACTEEMRFMRAMDALIDALPGVMRELAHLRYRGNGSFAYIAMRLNYSIDHIKTLDRQMVCMLGEKMDINGLGFGEGQDATRYNTSAVV